MVATNLGKNVQVFKHFPRAFTYIVILHWLFYLSSAANGCLGNGKYVCV